MILTTRNLICVNKFTFLSQKLNISNITTRNGTGLEGKSLLKSGFLTRFYTSVIFAYPLLPHLYIARGETPQK